MPTVQVVVTGERWGLLGTRICLVAGRPDPSDLQMPLWKHLLKTPRGAGGGAAHSALPLVIFQMRPLLGQAVWKLVLT